MSATLVAAFLHVMSAEIVGGKTADLYTPQECPWLEMPSRHPSCMILTSSMVPHLLHSKLIHSFFGTFVSKYVWLCTCVFKHLLIDIHVHVRAHVCVPVRKADMEGDKLWACRPNFW